MIKRGTNSDLIMCKDCDWQYEGYGKPSSTVTSACQNHAKRQRHTVLREITSFVHYMP